MDNIKVYLDNCCFNRPFDDQTSLVVYLETEAKLRIQELILIGEIKLAWSFVLDYESAQNPYPEVRERVAQWKTFAYADCSLSNAITTTAHELMKLGLKQMDASHIACAIHSEADYFLTTDKRILNKTVSEITVMNPIDFIRRYHDA
ncbi:hypothetical protein AGMMS49992_25470 [Clostridia bacterium]|nr:hypothetical protein AGMMS49992_25470 [Clostridia bacterium]